MRWPASDPRTPEEENTKNSLGLSADSSVQELLRINVENLRALHSNRRTGRCLPYLTGNVRPNEDASQPSSSE